MIISPQGVCNKLNEMLGKDDGFVDALTYRIPINDQLASNPAVNCTKIESGYDTSALGFINSILCGSAIALELDNDEPIRFLMMSDGSDTLDLAWEKYYEDLRAYNEKHGTDHKPEARPAKITT